MDKIRADRWIVTIGVLFLAAGLTTDLSAAPPGKCEPWPSCKDGRDPPDDGEAPSKNPTVALWGGGLISSTSLDGRPCILESAQANGDHGVYVCQLGTPNVAYKLAGIPRQQTEKKGDPELCSLFDDIVLEPNSKYNYAWTDNCQDDGICTARILNWFSEAEMVSAFPDKGVGHTRIEAFANIELPGGDLNPFATSQLLDSDLIRISFSAVGTNKRLATCEFDLSESWLGTVQFQSTPQL